METFLASPLMILVGAVVLIVYILVNKPEYAPLLINSATLLLVGGFCVVYGFATWINYEDPPFRPSHNRMMSEFQQIHHKELDSAQLQDEKVQLWIEHWKKVNMEEYDIKNAKYEAEGWFVHPPKTLLLPMAVVGIVLCMCGFGGMITTPDEEKKS